MSKFDRWSKTARKVVNGHNLETVIGDPSLMDLAVASVAASVSEHYVAPDRLAEILAKFGHDKAAESVKNKLPTIKSARSGDLGEIIGSNFIDEKLPFTVAIQRLRWKDHREMAMRGDDILAMQEDETWSLLFLKAEVKSRQALATATVVEAREALDRDEGRPSPHSLAFVADRLRETGNKELADRIDDIQIGSGIDRRQVSNLLFTFSGNDPTAFLESDLNGYVGNISQLAIGLVVPDHADFVAAIYEKVGTDEHGE